MELTIKRGALEKINRLAKKLTVGEAKPVAATIAVSLAAMFIPARRANSRRSIRPAALRIIGPLLVCSVFAQKRLSWEISPRSCALESGTGYLGGA
jgi:hypothetical protein